MNESQTWPAVAFVVTHTHWDREWYRPYGRFRVSLVGVVRQVLDRLEHDPAFEHFLLDGQSILVEDYLEACPEDRARLTRMVGDGSLAVGPWYVLPDEFLVSGESTFRNLLIGDRVARTIGSPQHVGYLPDSFGHIAQMPQILRLAGIDTFVFSRGAGEEIDRLGWEFQWQAPDGSVVTAVNQCDGYCAAGGLGFSPMNLALSERAPDPALAVEQVRALFDAMRPLAQTDVCLVSNGCDHHPPQQALGEILGALRSAFPNTEFRHASLAHYLEAVQADGGANRSFTGEFLRGKRQFILPGVWSARMYLKQANDHAETLLTSVAEPLALYAHAAGRSRYPAGELDFAWKQLLRNHPHDSICGCSVDEVHREMMTRFAEVDHTVDQVIRDRLRALLPERARHADGDGDLRLLMFNPLPRAREVVVERVMLLPPELADLSGMELVDAEGQRVAFELADPGPVANIWATDWPGDWDAERQRADFERYQQTRTGNTEVREPQAVARIRLHTTLPALGHRTLRFQPRSAGIATSEPGTVRTENDSIENDVLGVRLHPNATFDLVDKRTGRTWNGLNRLVDAADAGDEYDFAPIDPAADVSVDGFRGSVQAVDSSPLLGRIELSGAWSLPAALGEDRTARSPERVSAQVRVQLTLRHNSPMVEVDCWFDNLARDHRLRVAFPTGLAAEAIVSDGHFYRNTRPLRPDPQPEWVQPPQGTWPQREFSLVQADGHGLAVLNRGLPEIEATVEPDRTVTLWLTLLRAVGWLSRDDLPTRRFRNAGPMIETPEAQCPGLHHFRYAVAPFQGDPVSADLHGLSRAWRTPVLAVQGVADGAFPDGPGLVEVQSHRTAVSAIKRHRERESAVVRLSNLTELAQTERLALGRSVVAGWRIDAFEERREPVRRVTNRLVEVDLRPWEIVTLELEFEPR